MNVSLFMCQIPHEVKRACLAWHMGRTSHMYRLAHDGTFSPEKLLAEAEKQLLTNVIKRDEESEVNCIKEYAEKFIARDAAERALHIAAEKVVYSSTYSYQDAVEYFRLCWLEHAGNVEDGH